MGLADCEIDMMLFSATFFPFLCSFSRVESSCASATAGKGERLCRQRLIPKMNSVELSYDSVGEREKKGPVVRQDELFGCYELNNARVNNGKSRIPSQLAEDAGGYIQQLQSTRRSPPPEEVSSFFGEPRTSLVHRTTRLCGTGRRTWIFQPALRGVENHLSVAEPAAYPLGDFVSAPDPGIAAVDQRVADRAIRGVRAIRRVFKENLRVEPGGHKLVYEVGLFWFLWRREVGR